ncbi:sporulation integral membrane protein YlbJ [Alicyclobacillus cellulosilyticus]|uniref:Sporulation integral membrane protein YlbJ n=1 Tax=Alicyclobacillus cellulosilyticus TaxID=1003997 RepID=A0A917KAY2_9BACL|nr:sporulation integral membrane protein YlbJ [Alicyclobacillus cellulosilyticus]GGJ07394.1 sporulation integral membrane protein YlbJ [Alicyclobacillus cellulosilyticus]
MTRKRGHLSTFLLGGVVVLFTAALVVYPKESFESGLAGLKLFWLTVFPSLMPFFILSELMLGLGVVRGLGVILEPLMRPLFSVPGIGAFALSMGLAAGYPMDAVITARFREQNLCTRVEGERLLAFTNTADPLFMFGAVAVGMLKSPQLGVLIAIAHYVSSFLVGVSFKLWGRRSQPTADHAGDQKPSGWILVRALREVVRARREDGRTFGKLLYDAVTESMQTLLMICGFIVFFAVLIEVLAVSGLSHLFGWPIAALYHLFGIHSDLVQPTLAGLLEIDVGSAQAANAANAPLLQRLALISGIVAWSGLSVHAQVASVLTQTDIRMAPYFLARFLHAVLAAVLTVVFWSLGIGRSAVATVAPLWPGNAWTSAIRDLPWWQHWLTSAAWFFTSFAALFAIAILIAFARRVRVVAFHARLRRAP